MDIAPPLYPSHEEVKIEDQEAECRCRTKFLGLNIARSFCITKSYVSSSVDFGLIVRLDIDPVIGDTGDLVNRILCWTDLKSGDYAMALVLGQHGSDLPGNQIL